MFMGAGEMARGLYALGRVGGEMAAKDLEEQVAKEGEKSLTDVLEGGCGGGLSFTWSTVVKTVAGEDAIGTLNVGEKVWAYNPQTKKMELQPILHVWINHDNDLVDLTITSTQAASKDHPAQEVSETIHTNKKHPFLTVEAGFVTVANLVVGMYIVKADGTAGMVTAWKVVPGVSVMYNLEVANDHTFTVGDGQWVVHNCGGGDSVTVGRWMSEGEYQKMVDTGMVQEGGGGSTYAAFTPEGYIKQAAPSSVYAEFDVPKSSFKVTNPQDGWIKFSSPNSLEGRFSAMKGLPIPQLPEAKNLILLAQKLP